MLLSSCVRACVGMRVCVCVRVWAMAPVANTRTHTNLALLVDVVDHPGLQTLVVRDARHGERFPRARLTVGEDARVDTCVYITLVDPGCRAYVCA